MVTGRVVRIVANKFIVETPGGLVELSLTNKIRRTREGANKPAAVGDEVEFEPGTIGEGKLLKTLPRRTKLCRAKGATGQLEGVLVANADRLLAVFSSRAPDPDFHALDRALVMGESGQMECAITINKIDLAPPPDVLQDYRRAGYRVFETCAITGKGLPEMRDWLAGRTTVLMGPSGVGKSSLLNAIEPAWALKTGELSERIDEGKHTTTWVAMFALPGGGHVVDTPGIEVFGLWGVEITDLAAYFPEMRAAAEKCKFGNCLHVSEPGCAVKAEVQAGRVAGARYEGYLHILKELRQKRTDNE